MGNFQEGYEISLKEGTKYDEGKLRYDLIPPEALEGLAKVLTHGAEKYEDRNWEKGIKYNRVYGALMRHIQSWVQGNNTDDESGLHHLDHAACCLAFLKTFHSRNMGEEFDNIPTRAHSYLPDTLRSGDVMTIRAIPLGGKGTILSSKITSREIR